MEYRARLMGDKTLFTGDWALLIRCMDLLMECRALWAEPRGLAGLHPSRPSSNVCVCVCVCVCMCVCVICE